MLEGGDISAVVRRQGAVLTFFGRVTRSPWRRVVPEAFTREGGDRMAVVGFCSMKGGTGKTTLAYNLAERSCSEGLRTVLVDYDPQEGSIGIADLRDGVGWKVIGSRVGVSGTEGLADMKAGGRYDVIVCDLPGSDSMALGRLLREMDVVLSPVGVGAAELSTASNFAWMAEGMGLPVVFVPNNLPLGQSRRDEMLSFLGGRGAEICPVMLTRRVAHLDALRSGLGVCEAFPRSAAAVEVEALWGWVRGRLGF